MIVNRQIATTHLWSRLAAVLAAAIPFATQPADAGQPNVVVITIDDLGYADIGPFGSTINRTPALDRMAAEGRRLTSFYAAPVCSPSRSSLMTGCYPKRVLPIPHVLFPVAAVGLAPRETTLAELLRDAGYDTAAFGKWHLGDQPPFLPTAQGFATYAGIPYSNDMGPLADGARSNLGKPIPDPRKRPDAKLPSIHDETGIRGFFQPPMPFLEETTVAYRVRAPEQQQLVSTLTERAVGFITDHGPTGSRQGRPFFLYLPHSAVHFPIYPGEAFAGRSEHGHYSDWVEEVDASVGEVLDAIRQAGLDRQTLVIFTSDNGGTKRGSNRPLRGFKGSTWEGGLRVCTICRWPGRIPAGTSSDAITGMHDILPTVAALAGGTLPEVPLDGRDISEVLFSEPPVAGPHESFLYFRGLDLRAIRKGRWKLHLDSGELYDLEADVGESHDLADEHAQRVAELTAVAAATDADLGRSGIGPGCRPLGRVEEAVPLIPFDDPRLP